MARRRRRPRSGRVRLRHTPAFEAAADRADRLTNVTRSNAQAHGMVFWDNVVADVAEAFRTAVVDQLGEAAAPRTPDIGGDARTEDVVADLRDRV